MAEKRRMSIFQLIDYKDYLRKVLFLYHLVVLLAFRDSMN